MFLSMTLSSWWRTAGEANERIAGMRQHLALKIEEAREALAGYERELRDQAEQVKSLAMTFFAGRELVSTCHGHGSRIACRRGTAAKAQRVSNPTR